MWDAFAPKSTLDILLDKPDFTIEELLCEPEILTAIKSSNREVLKKYSLLGLQILISPNLSNILLQSLLILKIKKRLLLILLYLVKFLI